MTNKKLASDKYSQGHKPMQMSARTKRIFLIKDVRIIQLLLAALVITQVPAFWDEATSYESYDFALWACQQDLSKIGFAKCIERSGYNSRVITGADVKGEPVKIYRYQ